MITDELTAQQSSHAELLVLRQRVAALEEQLVQGGRVEPQAGDGATPVTSILNALDDVVWAQSPTTFDVMYLNRAVERMFGYPIDAFFADSELWVRLIHAEDRAKVEQYLCNIVAQGADEIEYRVVLPTGDMRWVHDRGRMTYANDGQPLRIDGIATDITERKQALAEQEIRRQQEEVIRLQTALLHELSTPLIPISDNVVVLPLIGSIDSHRAQQVLETLLHGISTNAVQVAILDITGVPVVDTQVAQGLLRAAQAVTLMGAQMVLTGIRPEVAQTLAGLGVNLDGIVTRATVQSGIACALARR